MWVASVSQLLTLSLLTTLTQAQLYSSDLYSSGRISATQASGSNGIPSTVPSSVVPVISRTPSVTPVSAATTSLPESSNNGSSEKILGIVLGAVIGGIAVLMLIVILACAFRRRNGSQPYTRTPSPEEAMSGPLAGLAVRRLFSSRSAEAPELATTEGGLRSFITRRSSSIRRQPTWSRNLTSELGDIRESPQITPLNQSHQPSQDSVSRPEPSRISLSRYHSRSQDLVDATSRKSDATSENRKSSLYASERTSHSETEHLPTTPHSAITPLTPLIPQPLSPKQRSYFDPSEIGRQADSANDGNVVTPLIPARNPKRQNSPLIHYPSWNEVQDFNFGNDNRPEQPRRVSRNSLVRLSDGWRAGGDRASGRYELA